MTDWNSIGGNPAPGSPIEIDQSGSRLRNAADLADSCQTELGRLSRDWDRNPDWSGEAAKQFHDQIKTLPDDLIHLRDSYNFAGGALQKYARQLTDLQRRATEELNWTVSQRTASQVATNRRDTANSQYNLVMRDVNNVKGIQNYIVQQINLRLASGELYVEDLQTQYNALTAERNRLLASAAQHAAERSRAENARDEAETRIASSRQRIDQIRSEHSKNSSDAAHTIEQGSDAGIKNRNFIDEFLGQIAEQINQGVKLLVNAHRLHTVMPVPNDGPPVEKWTYTLKIDTNISGVDVKAGAVVEIHKMKSGQYEISVSVDSAVGAKLAAQLGAGGSVSAHAGLETKLTWIVANEDDLNTLEAALAAVFAAGLVGGPLGATIVGGYIHVPPPSKIDISENVSANAKVDVGVAKANVEIEASHHTIVGPDGRVSDSFGVKMSGGGSIGVSALGVQGKVASASASVGASVIFSQGQPTVLHLSTSIKGSGNFVVSGRSFSGASNTSFEVLGSVDIDFNTIPADLQKLIKSDPANAAASINELIARGGIRWNYSVYQGSNGEIGLSGDLAAGGAGFKASSSNMSLVASM